MLPCGLLYQWGVTVRWGGDTWWKLYALVAWLLLLNQGLLLSLGCVRVAAGDQRRHWFLNLEMSKVDVDSRRNAEVVIVF